MTERVIMGIHGLLNKPARQTLEAWWADALLEGLKRNGAADLAPAFELAYWADVRHASPIALAELDEPYLEASGAGPLPRYEPGLLDKAREVADKWGSRKIDKAKDLIGVGPVVEELLGVKLADLGEYYADDRIRQGIRRRLGALLDRHRDDSILLIAHSMGSIIAHDVLRELESASPVAVEHWITIGSPLGLPLVSKKIRDEFGEQRTPTNVRRWSNLADPGDKVALDCNLETDYGPGLEGVQVEDVLVENGYVNALGEANNHKSYGYLRVPELSDRVDSFLSL